MALGVESRGSKIRENIIKGLEKVIKRGAKGVVMVNPDGFIFFSAGDVQSMDEALAAYLMVLFPRARREMKRILRDSLGALLQRDVEIVDLLGDITLTFANQKYVGVYAEDYAILASVGINADPHELRTALTRAIIEIIGDLRALRELTVLSKPMEEEVKEIYPTPAQPALLPSRVSEIPSEEVDKIKSPSDIYKDVKQIILELRRDLRRKGDWDSALIGLEKLMVKLTILVDRFPEYSEHPAIKSILNWTNNTIEKIRRGLAAGGRKTIAEPQREKLEKSLIQILNYLRKILHLGER